MSPHTRPDPCALKARFGLTYQIDALHTCDQLVGLEGKNVLEVGGRLDDQIVREQYGARTWTAVDDVTRFRSYAMAAGEVNPAEEPTPIQDSGFSPRQYRVLDGRVQNLPESHFGRYDLVVSIAALEHVANLPGALDRMRRALKPGGMLFLLVGPIWSGPKGHHIYPNYFPEHPGMAERLLEFLRPWQHLAQSRSEMYLDLRPVIGAELAEKATSSIYESTRINPLFTEEYFLQFESHGLQHRKVVPWTSAADVDRTLLDEARRRHGGYEEFEWDGFTCVLQA